MEVVAADDLRPGGFGHVAGAETDRRVLVRCQPREDSRAVAQVGVVGIREDTEAPALVVDAVHPNEAIGLR